MTDLLLCPFCGTADAQAAVVSAGGIEWGQVECSCGATVAAGASIADAVAVWNTRALTRQAQVSEPAGTYSDHGVHPERLLRQTDKAQVSDNAVTPAMIDAALDAWDSSEGDDRGRMWNAIERAMQASATNSEAVSELAGLLERALEWVEGAEPYSVREGKRKDALQAEIETALAKLGSRAP
jgi:Lar family restriction alleviation protein